MKFLAHRFYADVNAREETLQLLRQQCFGDISMLFIQIRCACLLALHGLTLSRLSSCGFLNTSTMQ